MTSFTFSLEQLKSAPMEVRLWIEHEIATTLAALGRPERDPSQVHAPALAACTPGETLQIFELIKGNFLLSQVYFELGREMPASPIGPPLHALSIAEILRHTRLPDGDRLADCLTAINQAFQTIRNAPDAALFGFDQRGHVYVDGRRTAASIQCGSSFSLRTQPPQAGRRQPRSPCRNSARARTSPRTRRTRQA